MDRETIEKAAKENASTHFGLINKEWWARKNGFIDGAEWRINSVWHDTSEIPKEGEHIVIVMENRCFTSWFVTPDIAMMFKKFRAVLWAYSRDLLPEGKEGTK